MPRSPKKKVQTQPVIFQPDSAGIDIGATELFVAVPPDRAEQSVRSFGTFTEDLGSGMCVARVSAPPRHADQVGRAPRATYEKALTQMNLHLHHVISDLTGLTGLAIMDAILAPKAITATARKLACIIYHLLKTGSADDDTVFARNGALY